MPDTEVTVESVAASEAAVSGELGLKDFQANCGGGIVIPIKGKDVNDAKERFVADVKSNPAKYTSEICEMVNGSRPMTIGIAPHN